MNNCNGNLYRFVAGLGAVLFLAGIVFFLHVSEQSRKERDAAMRKMVVYSHEREVMIGKLKAYELAVSDTDTLAGNQTTILSPAELIRLKEHVDKRTRQLDLEKQILDDNGHLAIQIQWFIHGLLLCGVVLLLVGILFWYFKVQRFKNRLLQHRTRKELAGNE